MKIPKKLKIQGHDVTVKMVDDLPNSQWSGAWTASENLIEIRKGYTPTQTEVTLIHEIIHAVNNELDHYLVEALSQQLHQVLKDNKLIFTGK